MSYNGSGTFVINTSGQPVVTGTVISSTAFNALTADLGTGLSTAITKDGQTTTTAKIPFAQGMSAAVASNFAAGTVAAPGIYLSTDTGTGLYRIGANNDGFAISGTKLLDFGSALLGITGAATISTTLGVTGITTLSDTLAVNKSPMNKAIKIGQVSNATTFGLITFNETYTAGGAKGFFADGNDGILIANVPTGGSFAVRVNNTDVTAVSSTGLAVTGKYTGTVSAAAEALNLTDSTNASFKVGFAAGSFATLDVGASNKLRIKADSTTIAEFSGGAVAVTGTLSATTGAAVGGATAGAGGLAFPATAVAVADANTLDDYEEGTWTPVITSSTGTLTAYTSSGTYTKIGNQVIIHGKFLITTAGTAAGYAQVGGYPFTATSQSSLGTARETSATGNAYSGTISGGGTSGFVIGNANGAILWINTYSYDWDLVYKI